MQAEKGCFYAVGVGPGAADLLTVRATKIIAGADVIVAPRSEKSANSLALGIARPYIAQAEIRERVYPMRRDLNETLACWGEAAREIAADLKAGKTVAQITLGDPLLYSTSGYLLSCLRELVPAEKIIVIPGISAFQAAAAKFGQPLCMRSEALTILSGADEMEITRALVSGQALAIYKAGRFLPKLREMLQISGRLAGARAAIAVEQEDELLWRDLETLPPQTSTYLTVVLIPAVSGSA